MTAVMKRRDGWYDAVLDQEDERHPFHAFEFENDFAAREAKIRYRKFLRDCQQHQIDILMEEKERHS